EVAVAWREHGGEPYHYSVMSYDERGRVEALLRYTESLGFDAVYYRYNSANLVTSVRVADPLRQFTTFYGYNYNGQVDSVWTRLEQPGSGLLKFTPTMRGDILQRPQPYNRQDSLSIADISYGYTRLGNVEQLSYPQVQITTDYWYNKRGWLDSLESQYTNVTPKIFQQKLEYDSVGRIIKQESKNASQAGVLEQSYGYDNVDRLQKWYRLGLGDTVLYEYDKVGNRTLAARIDGADVRTYQYGYGTPTTGPNRLQEELRQQGGGTTRTEYSYNQNGSVTDRVTNGQTVPPLWGLLGEEHFGYSYRELNWKYVAGNPFENNHSDWRYRYNAMGEREQKRLYHAPLADSIAGQPYPWVYYLLGGSKDQLAVWHGQQITSPFCDTVRGRNVFLYPTEYITHGVEYNGVREDIGQLVTRPDGSKQLRLLDHVASVRASVVIGGSGFTFADYDPWGNLLSGSSEDRRSFNSRERDKESGVYNNGVRKYEEGRFLSVDPLWSKFGSWSPYVYCYDNPLTVTDPQGMQGGVIYEGAEDLAVFQFGEAPNMGMLGAPGHGTNSQTTGLKELCVGIWRKVFGSSKSSEGSISRPASASPSGGGGSAVGASSGAAASTSQVASQAAAAKSSGGGGNGGKSGGGGGKSGSGGGNGGSSSGTPNSAWTKDAPKQVTPGTKTIEHQKYNPRTGEVEQSTVHYDQYGRQVGRTDHTNHGYPANHTTPHHHVTTYGHGTSHGQERGPYPGTYKATPE
ncbi:MAG: hypothetical protein JNJ94_03050, partial [Chlorobi bacterium]|nr:hypothetical protein [Chlorobiota bacterium]